jgi:ribonuclease P protein component
MTDPSQPPRKPGRLTRRAEFVAVAKGRRSSTPRLTLQARERPAVSAGAADHVRFGLTVSRKVGTATERNRVKRRLRSALSALPADAGTSGWDYVVVARRDILAVAFPTLCADLTDSLRGVHRARRAPARPGPVPGPGPAPALPSPGNAPSPPRPVPDEEPR